MKQAAADEEFVLALQLKEKIKSIVHVSQDELDSCLQVEISPLRDLLMSALEVDLNYCAKLLSSPASRIDADEVERNLATLKSIKQMTLAKVSSDWDTLVNALRIQSEKVT